MEDATREVAGFVEAHGGALLAPLPRTSWRPGA